MLAVGVDMDQSNRPFDQKDDCKKLSHWSIVKCDWSTCSCVQLEVTCDRAKSPPNLASAWIWIQFGTISEICASAKVKTIKNGIGNEQNLRSFIRLFDQPRTWC